MKVIDLLNKIADGEELPNKFKFDDDIYYKQHSKCYRCNETGNIFEECFILEDLDKEIEIIEEDKKIDKIKILEYDELFVCPDLESLKNYVNKRYEEMRSKINEIIGKLEN